MALLWNTTHRSVGTARPTSAARHVRGFPARVVGVLLLLATVLSGTAQAAPPRPPGAYSWTPPGNTSWGTGVEEVPEDEAFEFASLWTAMFLDAVDDPQVRRAAAAAGWQIEVDTDDDSVHAQGPLLDQYIDEEVDFTTFARPYTDGQKRYLIKYLINHWHAYVPGFTASMLVAEGPAGAEAERASGKDLFMNHPQLATLLLAIIFDKENFKKQLSSAFSGSNEQPSTVPTDPFLQLGTEPVTGPLDAVGVGIPSAPLGALPAIPELGDIQEQLLRLVPPVQVGPGTAGAIAAQAQGLVTHIAADPVNVQQIQALAQPLTYIACITKPGAAESCSKPLPLVEPARFDVDGDSVPDVVLTIALPDVTTSPGGLGAKITVTRIKKVASLVDTKIVAKYMVPGADGIATAGFAGIRADVQTVGAALEDVVAAKNGDVRIKAELTHTNTAATALTLIAGFTKLGGANGQTVTRTTIGAVTFDPAPRQLVARTRFLDTATEEQVEVHVDTPLRFLDPLLGTSPRPKVTATFVDKRTPENGVANEMSGQVVIDKLPEVVDVVIDLEAPEGTLLDYKATGRIDKLTATVRSVPFTGRPAMAERVSATVTKVPEQIRVALGQDRIDYTASSVVESADVERQVTDRDGVVSEFIGAEAYEVPSRFSVVTSAAPFAVRYEAGGPLPKVTAEYVNATRAVNAKVTVTGIPGGTSTLTLDMPGGLVTWAADGEIDKVDADAVVQGFVGDLTIEGIPRNWSARYGDDGFSFLADGDGIDLITGTISNHGAAFVPKNANGTPIDHASLRILPVPGITNIDASLRLSNIRSIGVRTGEPTTAEIQAVGGKDFRLYTEVGQADGMRGKLDARFSPLPATINGSFGRTTTITTDRNFDLRASFAFGQDQAALNDVEAVPLVHGIAVRDGASGDKQALKSELYLTGLPTSVSFGNGTFALTNFAPAATARSLTVDADLNDIVTEHTRLLARLTGLPARLDLNVASSAQPLAQGGSEQKITVTSNVDKVGAFYGEVRQGRIGGSLDISNIPGRAVGTLTESEGKTKVSWQSLAITKVIATFRAATDDAGKGALSVRGGVTLTDIPGDLLLTVGRDDNGAGPVLTYEAGAPGLDIVVHADGTLRKEFSALTANLNFDVKNLGKVVTLAADGGTLKLTSEPATQSIVAKASARYQYNKQGGDTLNEGSWLEFPYDYSLHLSAGVNNFTVTLTNVKEFTLEPGVFSKITGTYDNFTIKWDQLPFAIDASGRLRVRIDWPDPLGTSTITLAQAGIEERGWMDVKFHRYANQQKLWFQKSVSITFCSLGFTTYLQPGPAGTALGSVGASFPNPTTNAGGAWYVAPNPVLNGQALLPNFLVDVAAYAMVSPRDFDFTFNVC